MTRHGSRQLAAASAEGRRRMGRRDPFITVPVVLAALAILSSCSSTPTSYVVKSPEERLVDAVQSAWATPGLPFLEGIAGGDTISTVEAAGKRSWDVTIPDPTALGGADHWTLQVTRAQVLPVDSGGAFVQWLGGQVQQVSPRLFLPRDAVSLLRTGQLLAVGDVEVRFGRTDQVGRSTLRRVAYLEPASGQEKTRWVIQADNRSPVVLREALDTVYDHMLNNDAHVMTCMGEANVDAAHGPTERKCISEALVHRFGFVDAQQHGLAAGLSNLAKQLTGGS